MKQIVKVGNHRIYTVWGWENKGKVVKIILMAFAYCSSCYFFGTKRRSSGPSGKPTDYNISCKFVVQWPPF
jgi:hypothetical protein